jgi:chitinase
MKRHYLLWIASLFFTLASCKKSNPVTDTPVTPPVTTPNTYVSDESFKIVAYMPDYRDPAAVTASRYKMITHLNFAFLKPNEAADGSLIAFTSAIQTRFNTLKQLAKTNKVKFAISVSGTTLLFENIVANASARSKLAQNIINFAIANGLDGVDMDWEYPSSTKGTSDYFTLLMKELSEGLHKNNIYLSAAVTPAVYAGGVRDGIKADVYQYVDFFNIMQYDGPNYDTTEPLNHASYKMTVASMDVWLGTKALPKTKAIMGLPLYGEDKTGAAKAYRDIASVAGVDINTNLASITTTSGSISTTTDWGFNGIAEIKRKTQLAKERGNGIMFWELWQDSPDDTKSLIKAANDQLARSYN